MELANKIIQKLKKKHYFNIGFYTRTYPDNLKSISKGFFRIDLTFYEYMDTKEFAEAIFQVLAIEKNNFTLNANNFDLYENFTTKNKLWKYLETFLSRFKTLKELSDYCYMKFNFLKPNDIVIDYYKLMKHDLEDGSTFETFYEKLTNRRVL